MAEKIIRSYKYRIYPTKSQTKKMELWLKLCALMYNFFINITETTYTKYNEQLNMYDLTSFIPRLRNGNETLKNVYSTLFYDVAKKVSNDYKEFFRKWRNEEKNNHPPKVKDINKYRSFTYPGTQGVKIKDKYLQLSKIGDIKIVMHRPLPAEGKIKSYTIKKYPTGKWFALFLCEMPAPEQRRENSIVGIDLGLNSFAVLSDGTEIPNGRFFKNSQKKLAKAQRRMAKSKKGTFEYEKWRRIAAKIKARSVNQRNDFFHKLSNEIIKRYDIIAVENLRIRQMMKNHKLANSIADASWRTFIRILENKAVSKGARVIQVDPANTSRTCSSCGATTDIKLGEQTFMCPNCGLILGRDHNAALNIKRLAAQSLGEIPESPKESPKGNADVHVVYRKSASNKKAQKQGTSKNSKKKIVNPSINKKSTEQLILYIIEKYEEKTALTRKMLRNLVYFCDINCFRQHGKTITESEYKKTEFGPLSLKVSSVISDLQKNKAIKENFYVCDGSLIKFYTTSIPSDTSIFSPEQRRIIDQTIAEYSYLDKETVSYC